MGTGKFYIAYGSNLSVEQMAMRCPDARVAGKAVLKDWRLVYRTHATIEPCPGNETPVLVWQISARDEKNLDRYEAWPRYYEKRELEIPLTDLDGKPLKDITAMAYIMAEGHPLRMPVPGYIQILEEGYGRFGFDRTQLEQARKEAEENGLCG